MCGAPPCGQPPQSRAMYNPSFNPGTCMDPYMRPPQGPPSHSMMGHRGMPPPEGMCCYQTLQICSLLKAPYKLKKFS